MNASKVYLIANFGGPRDLGEVEKFLVALLTDEEVIRTAFPAWLQRKIFTWFAKRRAKRVVHDYAAIGGASPIYVDTENIARSLEEFVDHPVLTFHRYLTETHEDFLGQLHKIPRAEVHVLPLYPQFSYTTTGSSARWMREHLPKEIVHNFRWIRSYPEHPSYINVVAMQIQATLSAHSFEEKHCYLLFSAHGLPERFVRKGDPYEQECNRSFRALAARFPQAESILCYQSKFGREKWLAPATQELCTRLCVGKRRHALLIPLSFTSDHLETLFEMERLYLPLLRERGFRAVRCPACNQQSQWVNAIVEILESSDRVPTDALIRIS